MLPAQIPLTLEHLFPTPPTQVKGSAQALPFGFNALVVVLELIGVGGDRCLIPFHEPRSANLLNFGPFSAPVGNICYLPYD